MNITNAKYIDDITGKQHEFIKATIDGEQMVVPLDDNNRHYEEIMRQVAASTLTIADAD